MAHNRDTQVHENIVTLTFSQCDLTCHVTADPKGGDRSAAIWVDPVAPGVFPLVFILLTGLLIYSYAGEKTHSSAHIMLCVAVCVCVCVCEPTGMTGSSSVSSATAVAAECVPRLRAAAAVLAVVWNTPDMTHKQHHEHTHIFLCDEKGPLFFY